MEVWIAVAVLGGILSLGGIALLVHRFRQGLVSGLELSVVLGTYLLIVAALVAAEIVLHRAVGSFFVVVMIPLWLLMVARARRRPER